MTKARIVEGYAGRNAELIIKNEKDAGEDYKLGNREHMITGNRISKVAQ